MDPVKRFSNRVEAYSKYRPGYPPAIVDFLKTECGLSTDSVIADVGSGTGILSELFLKHGNQVFGVEPNREMREAGERILAAYSNFKSVEGSAESTSLPDKSVDFIMAAQSCHWFEGERTALHACGTMKSFCSPTAQITRKCVTKTSTRTLLPFLRRSLSSSSPSRTNRSLIMRA